MSLLADVSRLVVMAAVLHLLLVDATVAVRLLLLVDATVVVA